MTLLKIFNQVLEEIPIKAKYLESIILAKNFSDEKTNQMLHIVRQVPHAKLLKYPNKNLIYFDFIKISLLPIECGINTPEFNSQSALKAQKYVCNLLTDINNLSTDIKFSFSGFKNNNTTATFSISWEL